MFEKVDTDFLKDWAKTLSKSVEELRNRLFALATKMVENGGLKENEAIEEAKSILFIEIKSDMQSSAEVFYGYVFGATEPFDWTTKSRNIALAMFKKDGQNAVGKYVTKDDKTGDIKPLWHDAKDVKNRTKTLEPSLIRTIFGMCFKKEVMNAIEIVSDLLHDLTKKPEEPKAVKDAKDYEGELAKWLPLNKEQLDKKLGELWGQMQWFDMTVSNNYANPDATEYLEIPALFVPMVFKAINKTDKQNFLILNCSSRTAFTKTDKLSFSPDLIRNCIRFIKINQLDKPYGLKTNYAENITEKSSTQTTIIPYCTEGSVSSDLTSSPYSDILRLDDISLGFDVDKSVTMFVPKDKCNFGKNSRLLIFGKLTRKFDTAKKQYGYPSIQVSSWYILKLVKPIKEEEVQNNMQEVLPTPEELHTKVENKEKKEVIVQNIETKKSNKLNGDISGAVPLPDDKNKDSFDGL